MVKEGTFRRTLYTSPDVIPITLPPLRERLRTSAARPPFRLKSCRSNGLPQKSLNQDAVRVLMNYSWPGNTASRERVEHAVAMTVRRRDSGALAARGHPAAGVVAAAADRGDSRRGHQLHVGRLKLERELIVRCLEKTGGNKRQAARLLQLSRTTLIDKLHRLNLPDEFPAAS